MSKTASSLTPKSMCGTPYIYHHNRRTAAVGAQSAAQLARVCLDVLHGAVTQLPAAVLLAEGGDGLLSFLQSLHESSHLTPNPTLLWSQALHRAQQSADEMVRLHRRPARAHQQQSTAERHETARIRLQGCSLKVRQATCATACAPCCSSNTQLHDDHVGDCQCQRHTHDEQAI